MHGIRLFRSLNTLGPLLSGARDVSVAPEMISDGKCFSEYSSLSSWDGRGSLWGIVLETE